VEKSPLQHQRATEVVTPIAELGQDLTCRRIHSLAADKDIIHVSLGGMPPAYNNGSYQQISANARLLHVRERNKCSLLYHEGICWNHSQREQQMNVLSKFGAFIQATWSPRQQIVVSHVKIECDSTPANQWHFENKFFCENTGELVAFDVTERRLSWL
jgi:hypothetical protein